VQKRRSAIEVLPMNKSPTAVPAGRTSDERVDLVRYFADVGISLPAPETLRVVAGTRPGTWRSLWRRRTVYWIENDYMRLGPFETEAMAIKVLGRC
jgi:hypothetical protein